MNDGLKPFLKKIAGGQTLLESESAAAFELLVSGTVSETQMAGFLTGLASRGETVAEILGAVRVLRDKAVKIDSPEGTIDVCGTGGSGIDTLNVSTAVALVVSACGVPVAKHGNRAASSRSGSSDVLAALGVNLEAPVETVQQGLFEDGVCFLMAPQYHKAARHVANVRAELGVRTIFNILGPLLNPAGARRQLIGVYARKWCELLAEVLKELGAERAWIVHGQDGMDEITTAATTDVIELQDGKIRSFTVSPHDAGIGLAAHEDIRGGDAAYNAKALGALLDGAKTPYRDVVRLNAAAALVIAGKAADLKDGADQAAVVLDSGAAKAVLDRLVARTNDAPLPHSVKA